MNLVNPKRLFIPLKIAVLITALSFTLASQAPDKQDDNERGIYPIFKRTRKKPTVTTAEPTRIGIGYTLYKCFEKRGEQCINEDKLVRVDTNGEVKTGDLVRFVIEPNIDGFLYIFNSVNDGAPKMIFPNYQIEEGDNKIQAHVLYEVPTRVLEDGGWFRFIDKPEYAAVSRITEHLVIIVTRKPLPNVPVGSQLADSCKSGESCMWKPAVDQFNHVLAEAGETEMASSRKELGDTLSAPEKQSIKQKRDLVYSAPSPSLVVLNVSAKQDILVMKTQLVQVRN